MSENDLSFLLLMQQQQQQQHAMEQDQNSKQNLYMSSDLDNDMAPDDFILVEVVGQRSRRYRWPISLLNRNHSLARASRQMTWPYSFVRVSNLPCWNRSLLNRRSAKRSIS